MSVIIADDTVCDACGKEYVDWHTPMEMWNKYHRVFIRLCLGCFIDMINERNGTPERNNIFLLLISAPKTEKQKAIIEKFYSEYKEEEK